RVYKVRTGDTLSKIAKKQGVTVDQFCRLNHISRTKMLKPGQILKCS
ncbi:MAG: LysM peptidoglycan-binding domain-containing protein, partial [Bacteroidaceae bacterium]|nr:LysM peptidoglycan-binding domain-containing protein [Bacteroidaceae bacterium]